MIVRGKNGGWIAPALLACTLALTAPAARAEAADQSAAPACDPQGELSPACDAAIAQAKDPKAKSRLLFIRAYLKDARQEYEDAIADLDKAVKLDPDNAPAFHERAFARSTLMRYAQALEDLDAQERLMPNSPGLFQERAFSHFHMGDLQAASDDWDHVVHLQPNQFNPLAGRGDSSLWIGRFDWAEKDWRDALAVAKAADDKNQIEIANKRLARVALWSTTSGGDKPEANCAKADHDSDFARAHLIGDCTRAFLQARSNSEKADALTIRALAWLVGQQDRDQGVPDLEVAAALDPDGEQRHANLASAYMAHRHSWAARQEFDRALAIKQTFYALAGRASARYNLKDFDGAFADAKASYAMQPNDLALTVLGDLAQNQRHDPKAAKLYWMGAYHLGDRDDGLIARLKDIGVDDPAKEPAPSEPAK